MAMFQNLQLTAAKISKPKFRVLAELNRMSLSQLRRHQETGHLEHKIANASK